MTEDYIHMTTPLGLLPLNSTSMRALVDRINEQSELILMMETQLLIRRDKIESLTSGPGGIMEMKQTISDKEAEIERLQDIVTRMASIYKHLNAENHPGVYFIHGSLGSQDSNGMPEKLLVVPAYGCDFSYIYERTEKTVGPEW